MQAWEEIELARKDGEKQKSIDAAKKMKADGVSTENISKWLELSENEVQAL